MKRTNYYLVALLATVAIATSCGKEDIDLLTVNDSGVKITLGADASTSNTTDSKSTITGNDFAWEESDKLGVYVKSAATTTPKIFILDAEGGSTSGNFTGTLAPSGNEGEYVYAVYPHQEGSTFTKATGDVKYTFNLPSQEQTHKADGDIDPTSLGNYAYMYGRSTSMISEENNISPIKMHQIMTLIDFTITDIPKGTKIDDLTLYAYNGTSFAGNATVTLDNNLNTAITLENIDTKSIVVKLRNFRGEAGVTVDESEKITIRLAMFPQKIVQHARWDVALNTSLGEVSYTKYFSSEKIYRPGRRYTAPIEYGMFSEVSKSVEISALIIADRNQGASEGGLALNYTNNTEHADNNAGYSFKGDYYTWEAAKNACTAPWRLPNKIELEAMSSVMTFSGERAYLAGSTSGQKCYFPLSGYLSDNSSVSGRYWSSTENGGDAWALHLGTNSSTSSSNDKSSGYSVRCVKREGTSGMTVDKGELSFTATSGSSIEEFVALTVKGKWRVMTIEDDLAFALKGWIKLSTMEGEDDKQISVTASNNGLNSIRTATIFFKSVDYPEENPIRVTITQGGSGYGLTNYKNLGFGYDATQEYARQSYVKAQVLDWDKLGARGYIADVNNTNDSKSLTILAKSSVEYQRQLSVSAGMSQSIDLGKVGFSRSLSVAFDALEAHFAQTEFATTKSFIKRQVIKLHDGIAIDDLQDCLTDEAYADIVEGDMTVSTVLQKYGTFVMTGFSIGGVYEYNMAATRTASQQSEELNVAMAASASVFKATAGFEAEVGLAEDLKKNSHNFTESFSVNGGTLQSDFDDWASSINDDDQNLWALVDFEGDNKLVGIWELLPENNPRKQQLYDAAIKLYKGAFPTARLSYGDVQIDDFIVKDRNEGPDVPTYGYALNYNGYSRHPDNENIEFLGVESPRYDNNGRCIYPWRIPTGDELRTISTHMKLSGGDNPVIYIEGTVRKQRCYFPVHSPNSQSPYEKSFLADYMSSQYHREDGEYLFIGAIHSSIKPPRLSTGMGTNNRNDSPRLLRCVRDAD